MAVSYLQMLDSTTTAEVTEFLKKSLESFKIPLDKIKSVCTDGGSIAVKSCKNVFGEINHVVCVSKTLDSVVKKSLITISAVKDLISKLKVIVKFFKQSSIAAELKKEQMKKPDTQLSKTLMLIECMPSSWKSILKAVQRFVLLLPDVKTVLAAKSDAPKLDDATLTSLTAVESLLHHFGIVSDKFSGSLVAPSSGSTIINIQFLLHAATDNKATDHITAQLRENLSKELKTGFEGTLSSTLLAAANLVDPR
jgi:hypothetical protein